MKSIRSLRRVTVALMLLVAFLFQGTWALAGTTGTLNGQVTDTQGAPLAGVNVTATSPSQTAKAVTDAHGSFVFISLAPDTYSVAAAKKGYQTSTEPGVTVFADQQLSLAIHLGTKLRKIIKVSARAGSNSLVKSSTTASVYTVNAASAAAQTTSAGGYNLNSAYSAIYNQPGVQGAVGGYGWGQVFYIRGSSYSQVGYEFDGVPVNRAFDNYNASLLSTLGQQQLQVYTGGSPAGVSSATLGGFINQVIKIGTYPGFGRAEVGLGNPGFYHGLKVEAGGATPNRLFSYYVGLAGYDQTYRFFNNQDAGNISNNGVNSYAISGGENTLGPAGFDLFNTTGPWPQCLPSGLAPAGSATVFGTPQCLSFAPTTTGVDQLAPSYIAERDTVVNLHFAIPHKHDAGRDDVQVLFDNFSAPQSYGNNLNLNGGIAGINSFMGPTWYALGQFGLPGTLNALSTSNPVSNLCANFQSLYTWTSIFGPFGGGPGLSPTSPQQQGLNALTAGCANGVVPVGQADGMIYAPGTAFGARADASTVVPYLMPFSNQNRGVLAPISSSLQDGAINNGSIVKLQYQKNMGSSAYLRLLGYTFYSDWLMSSPYGNGALAFTFPLPTNGITAGDYELSTHTRGLQLDYANQINDQNLVQFTGNYTTASTLRWNNFGVYQSAAFYDNFAGINPTSFASFANGVATCYNLSSGVQNSCFKGATEGNYVNPLNGNNGTAYTTSDPCATAPALAGSAACLAGAKIIVTVPGESGYRNTVVPAFSNFALSDEFRPNSRLDLNIGVRDEIYKYNFENTNTPSNQFWFSAAANSYCYWSGTGQVYQTQPNAATPASPFNNVNTVPGENPGNCYNPNTGLLITDPNQGTALHPNGMAATVNGSAVTTQIFSAVGPSSVTKTLLSPRIGGTYTVNPDTVLRFSYGRYTQPTETAFEQYIGPSGLFAAKALFTHFWGLGFHNPVHDNPVQSSTNWDISLEKHVKGTDMTFKITPYSRYTSNQLIAVPLGTNFTSGMNAATQKSTGIEFALQKGDPARDGWSGQFAYTLSSVKQKYSTLSNGSNAIANMNSYILAFNSLTKAGGGSPCYSPVTTNPGAPVACGNPADPTNTAIVNPYYGMSPGATLDPNGWYPAYTNNPPVGIGSTPTTQNSPNQFNGFLNFRKKRFDVAATFMLQEGNRYGTPYDFVGYDPRYCGNNQLQDGVVGTDTNLNVDYQTCGFNAGFNSMLAIPNPATGSFNAMGAFREPWDMNIGANFTYDVSPRVRASLALANIVNRCFGGQKPTGSIYSSGGSVCGWNANAQYISNFYYGSSPSQAANGTAGYLNWENQPYLPLENGVPFQAYLNVSVKL